MPKTMVRTDGSKTELWFRCEDLQETPAAPKTIYEWRNISQPAPFEDDANADLHDPVGGYGHTLRRLTDGTGGSDDEVGAGVVDDGSLGGLFAKAIAEAESRESVNPATERIPDFELRLWIEWLTNTTYAVTVRVFSYGQKRANPDTGVCQPFQGGAEGEFKSGYVLDAADLGLEGTVGDVAWLIKTKVLDPIKVAESIP